MNEHNGDDSPQSTTSLLKILHNYQKILCHNSFRTLRTLLDMKITNFISFLRKFMFLVGTDWFIFSYYTTLFQVELIRSIPRNERESNNEQYARKQSHADRRSLVTCTSNNLDRMGAVKRNISILLGTSTNNRNRI